MQTWPNKGCNSISWLRACRLAAQPRAAACTRSAAAVCSAYRRAAQLYSLIARCTCSTAVYLQQMETHHDFAL